MSYPPTANNGNSVGYGPPCLPLSIPEIESRLARLVNACNKQKVNSMHYIYWDQFSDVLCKSKPTTPRSPGSQRELKLDGTVSVHHKTAILRGLLFSEEARVRQLSDPEFALLVRWAGHAANLARCISTTLRETLSGRALHVEKLLDTLATAYSPEDEQPTSKKSKSKRRAFTAEEQLSALREIASVLDADDWKPLTTLSMLSSDIFSNQRTKTFPCLNPTGGDRQQQFLATAEQELVSMLTLEGSGALSTEGSIGGIVRGLLCLTKMQSNVEGTLDAHGTDFWVIHVVQSSLCRNTGQFLVGNKLDFEAGRLMGQKSNRAAATEIWGDIVRGMHNSIGQKICCLVLKLIRGPLLKRYGEIRETHGGVHLRNICPTFDADYRERQAEKASDLQELYDVDRHGSSDAKTRSGTESRQTNRSRPQLNALDLTQCMPEKFRAWCEAIATDGRRSGVGLALDARTVGPRITRLCQMLHMKLLYDELDLAIADQYRQLYIEQIDNFEELYPEHRDDIQKKNEFAGNSTVRLLRAPEEDEEGVPVDHRRIRISTSCFEMHASPENKALYGTDDDTLFPQEWLDAELIFSKSALHGVYRGSIVELFGKNGVTGTHATPDDRARFRDSQRHLLRTMAALEQARKEATAARDERVVCVPPVLTAAAEEPTMETVWPIVEADAQLSDLHRECLKAVDKAIALDTSVRMATRITQAWTSLVETTRSLQRDASGLLPVHNFTHYSFLFETLCFAAMAPGGAEAMNEIVKVPVDAEGKAGFPQIVSPLNESTGQLSGWAQRDWPTFCAIAESAVRFFAKKSETFLSMEGSVVEVTPDGRFVVNEGRMARLRPAISDHMEAIKAIYGETCPTSLIELLNLSAKSGASIGHTLSFWLSWNDARVAKKIVVANGKEPFPALPLQSRSTKTSSKASQASQSSLSPMLLGAQMAESGKAQIQEMIKMSTILLRKAPLPSPGSCGRKRKVGDAVADEDIDEDDLFGEY